MCVYTPQGIIDVIHKLERYPPVQIVLYIDGIDTIPQEHTLLFSKSSSLAKPKLEVVVTIVTVSNLQQGCRQSRPFRRRRVLSCRWFRGRSLHLSA